MAVLQQTFVNATGNDLALQYASVVSKLRGSDAAATTAGEADPVVAECRAAIESGTDGLRALVTRYVLDAGAILNVPEHQIEGFFALLLATVHSVAAAADDEELEADWVAAIVKAIEEHASEKGTLKIKLLTHTFNALSPQSTARYAVFSSIVRAAAKHGELKALVQQVPHLQRWAKEWGTSEADLWALYILLAERYLAAGLFEEAHFVMVAHLATKPAKKTSDVESLFVRALLAGLLPHPKICDLAPLFVCPTTAALAGTPAHKLLTAYVHGDYLGYKAVHQELAGLVAKAAFPAKIPLPSAEDLQKRITFKMRQLYLTTLPLGTPAPLATLAKDLGLQTPRDVESVAIAAIEGDVVKGRIDGVAKTLLLTSAFKQHFTIADWEGLLTELHGWKAGLVRVGKAIELLSNTDDFDDVDEDEALEMEGLDGSYVNVQDQDPEDEEMDA